MRGSRFAVRLVLLCLTAGALATVPSAALAEVQRPDGVATPGAVDVPVTFPAGMPDGPSVGVHLPLAVTGAPADAALPVARPAIAETPSEGWTRDSHWKRDASGRITRETYLGPQFKLRGGVWTPIDSTVRPRADASFPLESDGLFPIKFGRTRDAALRLELPNGAITLSAPELTLATPAKSAEGSVRFANVANDTDLVFRHSPSGLQKLVVLRSAAAPRTFRFHLADPQGALGAVVAERDGSFRFSRALDADTVLRIPPAFAYEGTEQTEMPEPDTAAASQTVVRAGDGFDVTVSLRTEWLAGRNFPISLDPTLIYDYSAQPGLYGESIYYKSTRDCNINGRTDGGGCGQNFAATYSAMGTISNTTIDYMPMRTNLKFSIADIPVGSRVDDASMWLQLSGCLGDSTPSWRCDDRTWPIELGRLDVGWNSANKWYQMATNYTVTEPVVTIPTFTTATLTSEVNRTKLFSLKNMMQQWVNRTEGVDGLVMKLQGDTSLGSVGGPKFSSMNDPAEDRRPYIVITYAEPVPTLTKTVSPTTGIERGEQLTYTLRVTNTFGTTMSGVGVVDTLPASGLDLTGFAPTIAGVACGSLCVLAGNSLTVSGLSIPANSYKDIVYKVIAIGSEKACATLTNSASASNAYGSTPVVQTSTVVCEGGLGVEPWWSYLNEPVGPQSEAMVNVANGNLVVRATDSTPVQARGRLAYVLGRTYNSQAPTVATLPGSLGAGWQLNLGGVDGLAGGGLTPTGLIVPSAQFVTGPLAVTLADRDGTQHVFRMKSLSTPIAVPPLGVGSAGSLTPRAVSTTYASTCVDATYQAPAGVHLSLWRYIGVNSASCGDAAAARVAIGWAAVRPDRLRTEFSRTGKLLSMVDGSGVELRYVYQNAPINSVEVGKLRYVYEPRSCATDPTVSGSTCRAFRFAYTPDIDATAPTAITVTDPAGRATRYELDSAAPQHLLAVVNPPETSSQVASDRWTYRYQGVGGESCVGASAGQLCSITDPNGNTTTSTTDGLTKFEYSAGDAAGGRVKVAKLTDRRSKATTMAYDATSPGYVFVDKLGHRTRYRRIDPRGRVRTMEEGTTGDVYQRQTDLYWDRAANEVKAGESALYCRGGSQVVDNNLCRSIRRKTPALAVPSGTDPAVAGDIDTSFDYTPEGQTLAERRRNPGQSPTSLDTTYGYSHQYVRPSTASVVADTPAGAGLVTVGTRPTDADLVYVVSDRTRMLPPRGNVSGAVFGNFLTEYTVANTPTASPNATPSGTGCAGRNSGSLCEARAPHDLAVKALTTYTYDEFGQRLTMRTPKSNNEGGGSYAYTYYADADLDLSGTVSTGGWLQTITDPLGKFVAFGYDPAGNVARTWDRNRTTGTPASFDPDSPGSTMYAETRRSSNTNHSNPWRYTTLQRDPLENATASAYDRNGNRTSTTDARGKVTTFTYDPAGNLTAELRPEQAAANKSTVHQYGDWGQRTATTDPEGHSTVYVYDAVNRLTDSVRARGAGSTTSTPGCRAAAAADAPITAGTVVCAISQDYDALGNTVWRKDGAGQRTDYTYDSVGRETSRLVPRNAGGITTVRTDTVYDAAGNVTDACSPRQFAPAEGNATSCTATSPYATHTTYDVANRPTQVRTYRDAASAANALSTSYDFDGNPKDSTDANTHITSRVFDLLDRLVSETAPRSASDAFTTVHSYDHVGNRTATTRPATSGEAPRTAFSYDADNRLVDTVDGATSTDAALAWPAGSDGGSNTRNRLVYDAVGNIIARYEPRAFTTEGAGADARYMSRTDYDGNNRTVAEYRPRFADATPDLGTASSQTEQCLTSHDPSGLPSYPADVAVCKTSTNYDHTGNIVRVTQATRTVTATNRYLDYSYSQDNLLVSVTSPDPSEATGSGRVTAATFELDGTGRRVKTTTPGGPVGTPDRQNASTYSSDGLVVSEQGPPTSNIAVDHYTEYGYDAGGNRITDTTWLNHAAPGTTQATPHLKLVASSEYYADNRLKTTTGTGTSDTDASRPRTSYTYDNAGNPTQVTSPNANALTEANPSGAPTKNTYTWDNLLATTEEPISRAVDVLGRPDVRTTSYGYDPSGRRTLTTVGTYTGAGQTLETTGNQSLAYYPNGRLASQTGRGGETIATNYTGRGDVAATTVTPSAGAAVTTTSTYYLDGLARSVTQSGRAVDYAYDGSGQLALRDEVTASRQTSLSYGNSGLPLSMGVGLTGGTITWTYDPAGQLMQTTNPQTTVTSDYHADGTLKTQTLSDSSPSSALAIWRYRHDGAGRVVDAGLNTATTDACTTTPFPTGLQCYSYDAAGRLDQFVDPRGAVNVDYDPSGNRVAYDDITFAYNPDNAILESKKGTDAPKPHDYDAAGRLISDNDKAYCYDGFDLLLSARNPSETNCSTGVVSGSSYTYDALDRQVTQTTITNSVAATTSLHYDGSGASILTEDLPTGTDTNYAWSATEVVAVTGTDAAPQYLTTDGLGNVTTGTDAAGQVNCSIRFDPYGTPITPNSSTTCSTGATPSTVLFGGQRRDVETGTYQLGSRTYDPAKAGFLTSDNYRAGGSPDALGVGTDPLTANTYAYVNGDPVNMIDPSGHSADRRDDTGKACESRCQAITRLIREAPADASSSGVFRAPKLPGRGTVRVALFISADTIAKLGKGDGRDFDPYATDWDSRATILIDYETGYGHVVVRPSCLSFEDACAGAAPIDQVDWTKAKGTLAPVSAKAFASEFFSEVSASGDLLLEYNFISGVRVLPGISGHFTLTPGDENDIIVQSGHLDGYPSLEIFQYRAGEPVHAVATVREGSFTQLAAGHPCRVYLDTAATGPSGRESDACSG